jgi:hypothetical protein
MFTKKNPLVCVHYKAKQPGHGHAHAAWCLNRPEDEEDSDEVWGWKLMWPGPEVKEQCNEKTVDQ